MRIQSKFKDYYDYALKFGHDPKVFYDRETKILNLEGQEYNHIHYMTYDSFEPLDIYKIHLFFCGNLYEFLLIKEYEDTRHSEEYTFTRKHHNLLSTNTFFSQKELQDFLKNNPSFSKKYYDKFFYTKKSYKTKIGDPIEFSIFNKNTNMFNRGWLANSQSTDKKINILKQYEIPIVACCNKFIITNPNLSELHIINHSDFYDPLIVFQKISQYLSSELKVSEKPMIEITNDDKIIKHGFDDRSFKKEKQK